MTASVFMTNRLKWKTLTARPVSREDYYVCIDPSFINSTKASMKSILADDLRCMFDVISHIADIHKKNSKPDARDYKLCQTNATLCKFFVLSIPWVYGIACHIFQFPALLDYLTNGILRPSLGIYFPGVDKCNTIHMSALMLFNVSAGIIGVFQLIPSDTFIAINVSTIPLLSKIVRRQISELQCELNDNKKGGNPVRIKKQLIEIILMQERYNE